MKKTQGDVVFRKKVLPSMLTAAFICTPALAQQGAPAAAADPSPAVGVTAAPAPMETVTVTGSRIARKDFIADSPISTVSADTIEKNGPATIEATLNEMPQFAASSGGATQSGANQQARGARANLNLRGLGVARTLVLLDGRRLQPSDPFGNAVDLNTIPTAILANVEVISGGASAVYGSDAVAGVVNLITKKKVDGIQIDAQYGETSRHDGKSVDLSVLAGGKFADGRGNSMVALSIFDRKAAYKDSRSFFDNTGDTNAPPQGRYTPSSGNLPSQAALNALFASYGSAAPKPTQALSINRDNTLFATAPGSNLRLTASDGFVMQPGNTGFVVALTPHDAGTLLNPTRRYNGYGSWDLKINSDLTAYASVNYTTYTASNQQRGTLNGTSPVATVPVTNPFLPADLRTVLASRPNPNASFNFSFFGDRIGPQVFNYDYQVGQLTAGLKGNLGFRNWKWDAYASTGHTNYDLTASGYVNINALETLLNAADGGASICSGGYAPFSFAPVSASCARYLQRTLKETTTLDQHVLEATMQGSLAELPAGTLDFAAGLDARNLSYTYLGDDQQTNNEVFFSRPVSNSAGSSRVREAFVETDVPLLRDLPLVQSLDMDLAYRASDYNSIGLVNAYKASLDWEVADAVRFRGGYQRAVRAPSVGELYGGGRSVSSTIGSTASGQGDPCDVTSQYRTGPNSAQVAALCSAQGVPAGYRATGTTVTTSQQGNPNLKAEMADTYTAGVVLKSPFSHPALSGATLSVDYYKINVKGAIGYMTTSVNLQSCYNGDGSNPSYSPTQYNCSVLHRDANGNLSFPVEPEFNLSGYRTSGADLNLDWKLPLNRLGLGSGRLALNSVVSYTNEYEIQNLKGQAYVNYAGTTGNTQIDTFTASHPKWKAQSAISYGLGPVDLSLSWQYVGKMGSATNVLTPSANVPGVASVSYFDLMARWKLNRNLELRASVQNLADRAPPQGPTIGSTDVVAYDVLQRRYSVGLHANF